MNLSFVKEIFSNDNGGGSSHRTALLFIVAALLGWASLIVFRTSLIPDVPEGWVWLVGALVTGMAGGKGIDAYKKVKGPVEPTEPEPETTTGTEGNTPV